MAAKSMLIGGTGSHVGKSWMAVAICRWLRRRGIRVAPFKAQNMSNNSFPCVGGGEIGRAQVVQAEACGLAPSRDMNPILLKPNTDTSSQVVVQGKPWRNLSAREYYEHFDFLLERVQESYDRLAAAHDFIVIEGAGSLVELNLRRTDLVNLGLARRLGAPALLVGDIDRGGIFAAIYGTIDLLEPEDAQLIRAFAVNRFRGDPTLFEDGARLLAEKASRPCLGVFPYLDDVEIDEEDGVSPGHLRPRREGQPRIAILRFPRISNLTDFRLLRWAEWIHREEAGVFDVVILPGSKNPVADLGWMRSRGLDGWVRRQHAGGALVLGICGGYQMLGERIDDPLAVESAEGSVRGLGLLPVTTLLEPEKTTEVVQAQTPAGNTFTAYEIHMGKTQRPAGGIPFATVQGKDVEGRAVQGREEGLRVGRCIGTYLHGALENESVIEELLGIKLPPAPSKDASYDRLADWFDETADTKLFESLYL